MANSCWRTSKSYQTRAFTRQTRVKSQHSLNLQNGRRSAMALTYSCRLCPLVLFYVNRRRRNRKCWKNRKILTKPYIGRNPSLAAYSYSCSILVFLFFVFVCWRRNVPQIGTIVTFLDESGRCLTFVKYVRHFVNVTQIT